MPELYSVKQGENLSHCIGNKNDFLKVNAYLDSMGQTTKNQVKIIGVILETKLSLNIHVKAVTK